MNKNTDNSEPAKLPSDNITAMPEDTITPDQADRLAADPDEAAAFEYGEMNLQDAKESGYTDENGNAVSKARKDVEGSPTGAYTDIGAGRSSAVHHRDDKDKDRHH